MRRRTIRPLGAASFLFVLSGLAALVYQVAWQRILALHSGVGLYSISIIVAAFLAGLGLGSHIGGVLSERTDRRSALRIFAGLECAIGVFGAVSPVLYYDWLYPLASRLPSPSWQGGLVHLVLLLPPTTLMGMSLPFLVRAIVADVEGAGRTIGYLYGFNLLGAALGAAGGTWLLLPLWGIRGAVVAAGVANLTAGIGAAVLATAPEAPLADRPGESVGGIEDPGGRPLGLWLVLYALSGFSALSLEILWFRIVDVGVKSTAFTFGTVLSLYLLGNAIGCLYAAPRVGRLRRPLWVFLVAQSALLAYSGLIVILLCDVPAGWPALTWYVNYWKQYDFFPLGRSWDAGTLVRLYVVLPLVLFGPPTVLMGFSFPVLQRAVHDDPRASGRRVGFLQAANIAGCVAGSLLVGLLGLHVLGTAGTFRLLLICGLIFAAIGIRHYGWTFALPAIGLASLIAVFPDQNALWHRLHGQPAHIMTAIREDATSIAAITPESDFKRWRLSINGKGNSWFPYGGVHTSLGALPAVIHPSPEDVAVIGLGSGNTVWAVGCRSQTRSVTVFELSGPQEDLLRQLSRMDRLPDLDTLLADTRVRIVVADGRKALAASDARFDLIEMDAVWPATAYSGNLYSVEFFRLAASRLKPGGLMCTWAPTDRVRSTFRQVFLHVLAVNGGDILIGSNEPLPSGLPQWTAQLQQARAYFGQAQYDEILSHLKTTQLMSAATSPSTISGINRDLFPRDEFGRR